ncbi:unnamed protein product [Closterium sp. NIES-53]
MYRRSLGHRASEDIWHARMGHPTDEADWDEQNVANASEEAGPLPFCSVDVPMDEDNPRESLNAETFYYFADNGYVTPATVNTNEAERVGPNFIPDPEAGDEAAYPEDATLPRYSQTGLQILGLVTAVSAPGPVAASCSCRLLLHQTLLWHHRLGHPSLPRLRGMHSRLLVSGLPRSLPPLPPCLACVKGWHRAAPHSSSFPPTIAPLQTLHMDVWGPARVSGQGRERYILLVVDNYMHYTTVFPLRSKGEVPDVLIRAVRLQLRERFREDLPIVRLHFDRGGEFSSDLLRDFFRGEGILQSFTLPASLQQNGVAKHRIGLVMEVARVRIIL